jgi:hypothetical protein
MDPRPLFQSKSQGLHILPGHSGTGMPVPIQNLNPDVSMMQPAEDWYRYNAAELLRPPKI